MERYDFIEVAKLINHSGITDISLEPRLKEEGKWALYQGINKPPGFKYPFYVLYLYSNSTSKSIDNAMSIVEDPKSTQVVYPPSISKSLLASHSLFKKNDIAGYYDTREYLLSFVQEQLSKYLDKIRSLKPDDYVDPFVQVPAGIKRKIPNPILSFLKGDKITVEKDFEDSLSILIAEPGQGKTYMSKFLAYNLCEHNLVPIYINSQQWQSLLDEKKKENLLSLSKTITHSFRYFETPIGWIEGFEDEFLDVTLKAGLFTIIFDGFDEYILWNKGEMGAFDILRNLSQIAKSTGARILITSRTSFWNEEIGEELLDKDLSKNFIYKILPFDQNHAKNYFIKYLKKNEIKVKRATKLYDLLREKSTTQDKGNFVGRGFILNLIADLVDRLEGEQIVEKLNLSVTQWVTHALCEREVFRQKLPINAEQQIEILRELAELISKGEEPSNELLEFAIESCVKLDVSQLKDLIGDHNLSRPRRGKLEDHPLIHKKNYKWEFIQEQIRYNLLAERLVQYSIEKDFNPKKLWSFTDRIKNDQCFYSDVAPCIVEQIFSSTANKDNAVRDIKRIINSLFRCSAPTTIGSDIVRPEKKLATSIAIITVNTLLPLGSVRTERTNCLINTFPANAFKDVHFWGTISNMDLCGINFSNCRFEQVTWTKCKFDEQTIFESCRFYGGREVYCEGFGLATWDTNCLIDGDATSMINSIRISAGKKKYSRDDLKVDIDSMIRKFMPREASFKSLAEINLSTGLISSSLFRDEIIDGFKKYIIEPHHLSGQKAPGYNVRDEAKHSFNHYVNNKDLIGPLANVFEYLCKKLGL